MKAIAVTGAAGLLGQRVIETLANDASVDRVIAIADAPVSPNPRVEYCHGGLVGTGTVAYLAGCTVAVHIGSGVLDHELEAFSRLLEAADVAGCQHLVVVSSASVYGARPDNPIPITECSPIHPLAGMELAMVKAEIEQRAQTWAQANGARVAVLRPVVTLGARGAADPCESQLRETTLFRPGLTDPPVQFVHLDDLASAVALAASKPLEGPFNVAPDGWIEPDVFNDLVAEKSSRVGHSVRSRLLRLLTQLDTKDTIQSHLGAYGLHPWVVANDRLKAQGWVPTHTNEEVYVGGNPLPWWRKVGHKRRQEVALVAAVSAGAIVVAGLIFIARRVLGNR